MVYYYYSMWNSWLTWCKYVSNILLTHLTSRVFLQSVLFLNSFVERPRRHQLELVNIIPHILIVILWCAVSTILYRTVFPTTSFIMIATHSRPLHTPYVVSTVLYPSATLLTLSFSGRIQVSYILSAFNLLTALVLRTANGLLLSSKTTQFWHFRSAPFVWMWAFPSPAFHFAISQLPSFLITVSVILCLVCCVSITFISAYSELPFLCVTIHFFHITAIQHFVRRYRWSWHQQKCCSHGLCPLCLSILSLDLHLLLLRSVLYYCLAWGSQHIIAHMSDTLAASVQFVFWRSSNVLVFMSFFSALLISKLCIFKILLLSSVVTRRYSKRMSVIICRTEPPTKLTPNIAARGSLRHCVFSTDPIDTLLTFMENAPVGLGSGATQTLLLLSPVFVWAMPLRPAGGIFGLFVFHSLRPIYYSYKCQGM